MLILALETSTELGSCALWRDGVVTERFCPEKQPHSETLLPLVRELLAESGVQIADLDAIAFGVGPGAFTGLRVACGAAQGLAVAADLPLVAVTSLETMAAQSSATLARAKFWQVQAMSSDATSNGTAPVSGLIAGARKRNRVTRPTGPTVFQMVSISVTTCPEGSASVSPLPGSTRPAPVSASQICP